MTRRRPVVQIAALVVALVLGAAACTSVSSADSRTETVADDDNNNPTPPPTAADPPVTLPGPGVPAGECQLVTYTPPTAENANQGQLCVPAGLRRDAAVVLIHGGGGTGGDYTAMAGWADVYNEAGYTTLAINYHLFAPGVESPVFPYPEQDVKASVQYLRGIADAIGADPERIAVHGLSAGARVGAVAYTTPDDDWFEGPAIWDGIDDHVNAFIGFYSTYDGTLANDIQYHGGPRDDPDPAVRARWKKADAIVNSSDVVGPALFFTGDLDWAALITQQEQFVDGVVGAGFTSDSLVSPGGDHGYDLNGVGLSPAGDVSAVFALAWLDRLWPSG